MIGSLKGLVAAVGEDRAIVEVAGVGYLVHAGSSTLGRLTEGKPVHLHVETQLREDSLKLYGFLSDADRAWFVRLQEIPGVGAKVALAILDVLGADGLLDAITMQDKAQVARANGVGPKLAARIIGELQGKAPPRGMALAGAFTGPSSAGNTTDEQRREGLKDMTLRNEAVSALVNLGYGQPDALRAVVAAYRGFDEDPPVGVLVKAALKELGR
jgi:Holliday junction DNA helicase RuvA